MNATPLTPARSRRTLRRLLSACQRDLAFYRYCGQRIDDHELSATIDHVVQVREHLAHALSHSPDAGVTASQAERFGALRGWETSMRARLARDEELAYSEEVERVESDLLEQLEDATLDPRLNTGMRIMLERHLALVHSAHERAVSTANHLRNRKEAQRGDETRRPRTRHRRQEQETNATASRTMAGFFRN